MLYTVVTLSICIISRSILGALFVLGSNYILTVVIGRIGGARYLKMMMAPVVFLLLSTAALLVNVSRQPLDGYAITLGSFYLTGSKESLFLAVQLIVTSLASVSCLYFLSLSTPMTDMIYILEKIYCPRLLTELMLLIYRFIFLLIEIASAIYISQNSRLGYRNLKRGISSFGQMGSALFIQSLKKSRHIYAAMEARGYHGEIRVLYEEKSIRLKEVGAIIIYESILILIAKGGI